MKQVQRAAERGQSMTEYVLLVGVLMMALFLPNPLLRHPDTGQAMSVFMLLIEVFDIYINSFHAVVTMPIP
jgi:hypothetical protein